MFGNSDVDEKTRPRFDITTAPYVNMTKYELLEFVRKSTELGDTHFTTTNTGPRVGKTVVTRVVGTAPNQDAKEVLEAALGNKSVV